MAEDRVPQPGPAKLKPNAGPDEWLEAAKDCKYLSEQHMKQLCEIVKEYMMEGMECYAILHYIHTPGQGEKRREEDTGTDTKLPYVQNPISNPLRPQSPSAEISMASSTTC